MPRSQRGKAISSKFTVIIEAAARRREWSTTSHYVDPLALCEVDRTTGCSMIEREIFEFKGEKA